MIPPALSAHATALSERDDSPFARAFRATCAALAAGVALGIPATASAVETTTTTTTTTVPQTSTTSTTTLPPVSPSSTAAPTPTTIPPVVVTSVPPPSPSTEPEVLVTTPPVPRPAGSTVPPPSLPVVGSEWVTWAWFAVGVAWFGVALHAIGRRR